MAGKEINRYEETTSVAGVSRTTWRTFQGDQEFAFNTTKLIDGYQYEPLSQAAGGKFHSPPSSQCPLCVTLGHLLHPFGLTNAERRLSVPRVASVFRYQWNRVSMPLPVE
ncbi:uncharacterized protein LOC111268082 [Varroa jacobsoni]|uniref:uncharacterized protein LOC111268082 n=1 Tax=Varroa jacobsoni TaxID=62625 RepID=UPI000BF7CAAC|nr:uncharacterized protein LOC111268082 [Varroa jacobsoni]